MDKDFIETVEGLIFCVVGNVHPPAKAIAYLKYIPKYASGVRIKWSRSGVFYGRILPYYSAEGVFKVMQFMEEHYPDYIVHDDVLGFKLIEVPQDKVKMHYKPEERLAEIIKSPNDPLEEQVAELISIISEKSGVPSHSMGISGSILLKLHNLKFSDIDIIVYGRDESLKVKEALLELYADPRSDLKMPSGETLERWAKDITKIHPLTFEEAKILYGKEKWSRALYKGRQFSVHPVKKPEEVEEEYGDKIYRGMGLVKAIVKVIDNSDSIFLPAKYIVDDVRIIEGPAVKDIVEVVSYEGLYSDLAESGEELVVHGKLEHVKDLKNGKEYHRIVVGSFEAKGRDYIKPLRWREIAIMTRT